MILEEKYLLILIMILISSISAQKCKKPKVDTNLDTSGPVVRVLSGQCGGLHPGQAVPLPRAGLHPGHQEGRGLGQVPCSVSCTLAIIVGVYSSVAQGPLLRAQWNSA